MQRDDDKFQRWAKLLDPLFGEIEDMDEAEVEHILRSAGVDYEAVKKRAHDRLTACAASFRLEGKNVPADLQEALEAFRPLDAAPRNQQEANKQAQRMLGKVLEKGTGALGSLHFAFSYRNRGELTPEDIELLDSIVDKLKKKLDREE
jgi:TPR repeat protein